MLERPSNTTRLFILTILLGLAACGPSPTHQTDDDGQGSGGDTTTTGSGGTGTSGGDATTSDDTDVGTLLVDVVTPRLCGSLRGSFVGLPGEGGHSGPQAGLDPSAGRWWIRECTATEHDGRLDLSISGTGWTWVDRESMGFQVRQYLRFDASARFTATMEMAYDRPNRIITIWMRPQGPVEATVTPRGMVEAHATGVLSGMLGGLLELGGSSPNDQARAQVAEEGSARLRDRFGAGFTVTYAMAQEQMDFMVGALERGQLPERPFPAEAGAVWSVNQRLAVWPGGLDVLGPIDGNRGAHVLDFQLEEGESATIDAVCASDFEVFYDHVLQGVAASPPTGTRVLEITQLGRQERVGLPALSCPMLLLVTTRPNATMALRARTRICEGSAPTAVAGTGATGTTGTGTTGTTGTGTASSARPMRVRIAGMAVATASATGSRWDMIGSEPDPYVIVVSVPGAREIERTAVVADQHEINLDHWLPGAYHVEDLPLRFSVYDDDVGADELIGVAELTREQALAAGTTEQRLEIRTTGDVPQTLGILRVTIQPVL
ncbi:MAG: hypothetical protein K1X94_20205 [Sandaracinaceae bacterium]|nr:hypothetical protein [Sandaracinaceae bacterium]